MKAEGLAGAQDGPEPLSAACSPLRCPRPCLLGNPEEVSHRLNVTWDQHSLFNLWLDEAASKLLGFGCQTAMFVCEGPVLSS